MRCLYNQKKHLHSGNEHLHTPIPITALSTLSQIISKKTGAEVCVCVCKSEC